MTEASAKQLLQRALFYGVASNTPAIMALEALRGFTFEVEALCDSAQTDMNPVADCLPRLRERMACTVAVLEAITAEEAPCSRLRQKVANESAT